MIDPLARAAAAAKTCGVTRLGEITHLDCIGTPVFHAVRPWSRALSVHQGKGLTVVEAQIGALMEAVESAHAEAFAEPTVSAAWTALPADERTPCLADFATTRDVSPGDEEPLDWIPARRVLDGGRLWVPFDAVSLDFTRDADGRLRRSSNGQAAHFDPEAATAGALLEVIERDAVAAWFGMRPPNRTKTMISRREIPYAWFKDLQARIERAGLRLSVYELSAVAPYPALLAEVVDPKRSARRWSVAYGTGCSPAAEQALKQSVLEAVQSRVTEISGARDDIPYREPAGAALGLTPAPAPHMTFREWGSIADRSCDAGAAAIAGRLAEAGYPEAAIVHLSPPASDVCVVKAFVPGLGAFERTRRLQ